MESQLLLTKTVRLLNFVSLTHAPVYSWRVMLALGLVTAAVVLVIAVNVFGYNRHILIIPGLLILAAAVHYQPDWQQNTQRGGDPETNDTRYKVLFDQANDAIFMLDMDGVYLAVNWRAAQLLGYTVDELVGMNVLQTVVERERAQAENVRLLLQRGEPLPLYERTLLRKDGGEVPVEISLSVIRDGRGAAMFVQSIARDLTDRKRAEYQRLELEVAYARMEALRQFMDKTSHDLRTPISVMNTSLYLLRKKLPPDYAGLRHISAMEVQAKHLESILENLRHISELDEAMSAFSFGNVNLNTLVGRLLEQYQPLAQQKNLLLRARLAPSKVFVRADDVQLTYAVQNVLVNAINYTPGGGQVTISINGSGGRAMLEIRDTGIGIPPESLPHIFERFYRADVARPAHQGGLGLGLTITQKIIELHGGTIEVESQPGQGSCFRILLPIPDRLPVGEQFI